MASFKIIGRTTHPNHGTTTRLQNQQTSGRRETTGYHLGEAMMLLCKLTMYIWKNTNYYHDVSL